MKLIDDVKRVGRDRLMDAIDEEKDLAKAQKEHDMDVALEEADDAILISELYDRGVKMSTIFSQYYEMEVQGEGHSYLMEVGDVELAGLDIDTVNIDVKKGF